MNHCYSEGQSCETFYNRGTYISHLRPRLADELPTEASQIDRLPQSEELFLLPSFEKREKRVRDELRALDYSNPCIRSCSRTSSLTTRFGHQCFPSASQYLTFVLGLLN